VISPSGHEVGPFLSIEQAALSHVVSRVIRTEVFAWYTLAGSVATAAGALCGGGLAQVLQSNAMTPVASYRVVVISYAVLGLLLALVFSQLSSTTEIAPAQGRAGLPSATAKFFGIDKSRRVILQLSSLFALDSFAGGFV